MKTLVNNNKQVLFYLLKFGGSFALLYFGTLGIIGLSTPDNSYSSFVAKYLNFIDPLRASLLHASKFLISIFGYETSLHDQYRLLLNDGTGGIRMVYSCVGYGVMSFWAAFVIANRGPLKKKIFWAVGGLLALWIINVLRVSLLLVAITKKQEMPFGWDHHTWFNIFAYAAIFLMIYFYDRSLKASRQTSTKTFKSEAVQVQEKGTAGFNS